MGGNSGNAAMEVNNDKKLKKYLRLIMNTNMFISIKITC